METRTKKPTAKTTRPKTVAAYLAGAPADKRDALMNVRRTIKAAAPGAVEGLAYGLVGFKHRSKPLLYYGYAKDHCALYGGGIAGYVAAHPAEFKAYEVSKGTVRFSAEKPLPDRLVAKIVRARVAEIENLR